MAQPSSSRKGPLLLGIAVGLLVFAAGVVLATAFLPEWRAATPAEDKAAFRERYRELAARAGLSPEPGEPRVTLTTGNRQAYGSIHLEGKQLSDWLLASRTAVRVEVFHPVRGPGGWPNGNFGADFTLEGRPLVLSWWHRTNPFDFSRPEEAIQFAGRLAPLVLHPGESAGPERRDLFGNAPRLIAPILGASPPQYLMAMAGPTVTVGRMPGTLNDATDQGFETMMGRFFTGFLGGAVGILGVAGLFAVLALRSRIGLRNGALLALISLATLYPAPNTTVGTWTWSAPTALLVGVWIFCLWSCAESLLRSADAEFTTSLDALRAGRLGPRGGRALLLGLGFGGLLAGLRLALLSLAVVVPGVWPQHPAINLPLFNYANSPVVEGIKLAGGVALVLALSIRILPLRWAPAAAAVVAGALLGPVGIGPTPVRLAAGAVFAALLVYVARRNGLTTLLVAALTSTLLPAAAFSALHLEWLPGSFAANAFPLAGFAVLGWLGLSRPAAVEVQRLAPPAFVRRLEEERRLRHEMDLLARMQRGLLPRTLPRIEGYEMAARSILANEAGGDLYDVLSDEEGRVWIAAGDVAGHGYSCAIAQAMTKAALGSLIGRGRPPSEVLRRMDRVLRAAGAKRNFTSLALLRLDPATGEALLSNAGHPYPLLAAGGEVRELELPSLPLGQGPPRTYQDVAFRLEPGAALALCSDGLFEAQDSDGSFYGFERVQAVLRVASGWDADRILAAVFADWSHHLRAAQPLDDTTVVVLRRRDVS
jgi:serine phosphatase RsbU (regulator of sigma subunit)